MKQYRLLKDLPTHKAGTIFPDNESGSLYNEDDWCRFIAFLIEEFPDTVEWFEELPGLPDVGYKRWRVDFENSYGIGQSNENDLYFYINDSGYVSHDSDYRLVADVRRYYYGNYFKTELEAKRTYKYLKSLQVIKDDAKGFKPDWDNQQQDKYYGFYIHEFRRLGSAVNRRIQDQGVIYFKSEEDIKWSQEQHREEWLTILGVEE